MFETKKQLKEIINQLNSKIRELKDYSSSYSKLFIQATQLNQDYYYLKEEKDELDKQNATLEIINLKLKSQLDELVDLSIKNSLAIVSRCQKLNDENKQLKEQIEFLKKEYNELRELWCANDKVNRIYENKLQELESETKIHIIYAHQCEPLPEKEEVFIKPTYFAMDENHKCFDLCGIINYETKIGSLACQGCASHIESNIEEQWVKCSKRPEGKPQPNKEKRDKYGVVSECTDDTTEEICTLCVFYDKNYEGCPVEMMHHCTAENGHFEYYSSK